MNNMKKSLLMLGLPIFSLVMTSCTTSSSTKEKGTKDLTYSEARKFAEDNYDKNALNTVPTTMSYGINKFCYNLDINYETPDGGTETINLSADYQGIHLTLKDKYAYCISSSVVDTIEDHAATYYGAALSFVGEPPIELKYQLIDSEKLRFDVTTKTDIAGNVTVKLLSFVFSLLHGISDVAGYIDLGYSPKKEDIIPTYILMLLNMIPGGYGSYLATFMNLASVTISPSSASNSDVFDIYMNSNSDGYLTDIGFEATSGFDISGFVNLKKYAKENPEFGDRPSETNKYKFTCVGSFECDIKVTTNFVE